MVKNKAVVLPIIFIFLLFIIFSFIIVFQTSIVPVIDEEKEIKHNSDQYDGFKKMFNKLGENPNYKKTYTNNINYYNILSNSGNPMTNIKYSDNRTLNINLDTNIENCKDEENNDSKCYNLDKNYNSKYLLFITDYQYLKDPTIYGFDYPYYFSSPYDNNEGSSDISSTIDEKFIRESNNNVSINYYRLEDNSLSYSRNEILSYTSFNLQDSVVINNNKGYNTFTITVPTAVNKQDWNDIENKYSSIKNINFNSGNSELIRENKTSGNNAVLEFSDSYNITVNVYSTAIR